MAWRSPARWGGSRSGMAKRGEGMDYHLYNGDCLEVMETLPDKSIDAVITDVPYGTTACAWDSVIPLDAMWGQLKRLIKPRGAILLFAGQPFTSALVMSNIGWFKYTWIWDKVLGAGFQVAKYRPMMRHEEICVFGKGAVNYYPIMKPRAVARQSGGYMKKNTPQSSSPLAHKDERTRLSTEEYPVSLLTFSNAARGASEHPTQKPVALMSYLVSTYSREGDTILDFTMGSGSTGVACMQLQRNFVGVEKDHVYFEVARRRIEESTAQLHLFEGLTGEGSAAVGRDDGSGGEDGPGGAWSTSTYGERLHPLG